MSLRLITAFAVVAVALGPPTASNAQDQAAALPRPAGSAGTIRSPVVNADHSITFSLVAPHAARVQLSADFLRARLDLKKAADSAWHVTTPPVDPGVYKYRFLVDGLQTVDPANARLEPNYVLSNVVEVRGGTSFIYDLRPDVPHGTIRLETFESRILGKTVQFYVYTPPDYERNTRSYPVLYDLHGAPGFPGIWGQINAAQRTLDNLLAERRVPAMIYVIPTAEISPFFPVPRAKQPTTDEGMNGLATFERYFLDEFIPHVEATHRVNRSSRTRWLTGYSLGGAEAFHVGVRHPEMFSVIRAGGTAFLDGGLLVDSLESHYPELRNPALLNRLRLFYLDCGDEDPALPQMQHADRTLRRLGVAHEFTISSAGGGTHLAAPATTFAIFLERLGALVAKQ